MTFQHKPLMPALVIAAIFAPTYLVGKPVLIIAVGFTLGIIMAAVAFASTGMRKALSGGNPAARFYAWFALGMVGLAAFITFFVNSRLDALIARPMVHAQASMMPSVIWGAAAGFAFVSAWTWSRGRST